MSDGTKLIQMGLQAEGFSPGLIDGKKGPRTCAAAASWARSLTAGSVVPPEPLEPLTGALIRQGAAKHPVHEVALHCSGTPPSWMGNAALEDQLAEIRRWHIEDRHWKDIGYHWLIGRTGRVLPGRAETVIGAGIEGHNAGVIHCCLIGGHGSSETDPFLRNFTPAQDTATRHLIAGICLRTQINRIAGHNEYAAKACPGFNVSQWLKGA